MFAERAAPIFTEILCHFVPFYRWRSPVPITGILAFYLTPRNTNVQSRSLIKSLSRNETKFAWFKIQSEMQIWNGQDWNWNVLRFYLSSNLFNYKLNIRKTTVLYRIAVKQQSHYQFDFNIKQEECVQLVTLSEKLPVNITGQRWRMC